MMKYTLTLITLFAVALTAFTQTTNPNYDEALAKELGADDYGMKTYVMVLLRTGDNTSSDKALADSCFAGHMENINQMVVEDKLVVSGPMGENDAELRGIFILNVPTIEEANELLKRDPAINAGFLKTELFLWYGSAALPQYLEDSDKVWKTGF